MKKYRILCLAFLGLGTLQAQQPLFQIEQSSVLFPVRTREAGVITQRRACNAIKRQDFERLKKLLDKQKILDRDEKNELLREAQPLTDAYEAKQSFPNSLKMVAGGLACAAGLVGVRRIFFALAKNVSSWVKTSSAPYEPLALESDGSASSLDSDSESAEFFTGTDDEALQEMTQYLVSFLLIGWGTRTVNRALGCVEGNNNFKTACSIERLINNFSEVGNAASLNPTQD